MSSRTDAPVHHRAAWHKRRGKLWPLCGQRHGKLLTDDPGRVTCIRCDYMLEHGTLGLFRLAQGPGKEESDAGSYAARVD